MKLFAGALAAFVIAAAAPAAASAASCPAGQKDETISAKKTCVGIGASCSLSKNSQYEKYGYLCEYKQGKYKLERRPSKTGGYSYY